MSNTAFESFQKIMGDDVQVADGGKPPVTEQKPVVETPAPAQAEAAETPEIVLDKVEEVKPVEDFNSMLNGKFGMDENTLKGALDERQRLIQLSQAESYKSPLGKQFDNFVASGVNPEAAFRYLTVDEAKLGDKEVLSFKMQREMTNATPEQISRALDKKYAVGEFAPKKDDGEGNLIKDEQAEKDNLFQMAIDATPVRKEFKALKEEMVKPLVSRETLEKQTAEQQRINGWQPLKEKLRKEFKQIPIPYGNKDGKPIATLKAAVKNFDFTDEDFDQVLSMRPDLKNDDEGISYVKQVMEDAYLIRNKSDIFYKVGEWARSQSDKEWQKLVHNPQIKNASQSDFGGASQKTKDDFLVEGFANIGKK